VQELAPGLHRWTARHPEWHPSGFGDEVGSYALVADEALLLIDPLLADDAGMEELGRLAGGRPVHVLITIGYHVRSAALLAQRLRARVWGPPAAGRRLAGATAFTELVPGAQGPAGATALRIGRPVRGERPLWLPSHGAVAFGDSVVGTPDGQLRMWAQERIDERRARFYRERFAPTLAPILDLPVRAVLVTHGEPVIDGAASALRACVAAGPWRPRP
jgi:hypothetical protein